VRLGLIEAEVAVGMAIAGLRAIRGACASVIPYEDNKGDATIRGACASASLKRTISPAADALDGTAQIRHLSAHDGEHARERDLHLRDYHYRLAPMLAEAVLA
jgi:hypothetical protein